MIRFQWIGGPTFLLRAGSFRVLTDPLFAEGPEAFVMDGHPSTGRDGVPIARLAPLPRLDLAGLDAVVVSHLHSDHFDAAAARRLPGKVPVVAPAEQAGVLRARGFADVRGLAWWEELRLEKAGETLSVLAVPARHAHADDLSAELGVVNGYLVRHSGAAGGFTLYWTGDTVWFDGLAEIRERAGRVDLLVPHMGAVGVDGPYGRMTLDAEEGARLVELFGEATTIPIHHHTLSHYVEPVERLVERVGPGHRGRLVVLAEGESWAGPLPVEAGNVRRAAPGADRRPAGEPGDTTDPGERRFEP